jgi:hypothetical protein
MCVWSQEVYIVDINNSTYLIIGLRLLFCDLRNVNKTWHIFHRQCQVESFCGMYFQGKKKASFRAKSPTVE